MRKVIGIGETVLDIIFKNGKPIEAVPGGSSFNAVISLGRAGVNASFISEAGNDRIGEYVIQFLRDNGVTPSGSGAGLQAQDRPCSENGIFTCKIQQDVLSL